MTSICGIIICICSVVSINMILDKNKIPKEDGVFFMISLMLYGLGLVFFMAGAQ